MPKCKDALLTAAKELQKIYPGLKDSEVEGILQQIKSMKKWDIDSLFQKIENMKTWAEVNSVKTPKTFGADFQRKLASMSPEDRLIEYARLAYEETLAEKQADLRTKYIQVEKNTTIETYIRERGAETGHVKAVTDLLVGDMRGRQHDITLQGRKEAILALDMAGMTDAIDNYHSALGYKIKHEDALNVVKEIDNPGSTGDAKAKKLAEVWLKWAEQSRNKKNELGANIGHLEDWRFPQMHDPKLTKTAGLSVQERLKIFNHFTVEVERNALYAKAKANWVQDAMKNIDRSRYINEFSGEIYSNAEMMKFLSEAWETIATGGLNKEPGSTGVGQSLAKRLGKERQLHFKDAESWYEFATKYGERDLFTLMTSTIQKNARDVALLETFGPNPKAGFQKAIELAKHLDMNDKGAHYAQMYFDTLNGTLNIPVSERGAAFANAMLGVRQWLVAAKLGGMLLSQANDAATYAAIARSDGLGMKKAISLALKNLRPGNNADRALAQRMGVLSQVVINDVAQRYGETVKGTKLSSRSANATIALSGGNWWTNGMKTAYQVLIGTHVNDAVIKGIDSQGAMFKDMLERYGIREAEWNIIKKAQAVDIYGEKVITPIAIKNLGADPIYRETAIKVAAMLNEEADIAIVSPGTREAALIRGGTKPGTAAGELMRSFALFRTFTLSMMTKVLPRIFGNGFAPDRVGIMSQFAIGMMLTGAFSYQMKEIVKGRNPRDMSTPEFWMGALAQSGGLGIFGDFLYADANRFGGGLLTTIGGPVAGLANDFSKLTLGNIQQTIKGEKADIGADTAQFLKNYTPLINLWYTRAAIDHALFYRFQETLNPGYLRRMQHRVEKQNNQTFWWEPRDTLPSEWPSMGGKN